MRRREPRPVATALEAFTGRIAPATPLAEVQAVWAVSVGEAVAAVATPVAERAGTVTVACGSGAWAQELDLMSERLVQALNERLGRPAVKRLRVTAKPRPR